MDTTEKKALIAGILIGLGVIINALATIPVLGAILFSLGLLVIIDLSLPLYTGKIGFIRKKSDKGFYLKILSFNLIGIALCVIAYIIANPGIIPLLSAAAAIKFTKTYIQLLFYSIFCGMLIHFAVKCKKHYITIMAIMVFILIGAEHCIAAFPFLLFAFTLKNIIKYIIIIIGNSIGAIVIERMLENNEVR